MKVKVLKLHPNAVIPKYAKSGDAGLDLTVVEVEHIGAGILNTGSGYHLRSLKDM
ncbi:hypothetical protein [Pedobacter sp. HDW13]|uniref:hypothetical protein n=1 Tax=Pedobacter sp. HDW13 TaxID=2714940 RepID=UPI00197D6487|nr:hypothetical protein [Pedobacter sp. HDW13]